MAVGGAGGGAVGGAPRLPELREDDAPPAIRAIYDEIRAATGIPQVNLIWRHLALDPSVIGWAWETVGPLYRDGRVAAAAARLSPAALAPPGAPVWQGLPEGDAADIRAVLAFYDRGNATNLVGLTALLRLAGRGPGAARPATGAVLGPDALAPVPPLPRPEAIPAGLMALVTDLSARQGSAAFGVLPSLWLHLTRWPEALTRAHATVGPLVGTPAWRDALSGLLEQADGLAGELAATAGPTAPPPASAPGYLATVGRFVSTVIPQMLLAGRLLAGAGAADGAAPTRRP